MGLKLQPKYQSFGLYLKGLREKKYRSARDFCARVSIGTSYPQFSRYEAGDQLPTLSQALLICSHFDAPSLETLLEWNRSQLGENSKEPLFKDLLGEVDGLLSRIRGGESLEGDSPIGSNVSSGNVYDVPLDKVIVFNRSHRDVFSQDPLYRDIFTYINAFHPEKISAQELSRSLRVGLQKITEMLRKLESLGVVLKKDDLYTAAKRNFYFPDDADFFELRNQNLRHNFNQVMERLTYQKLTERKAFRGMITREYTSAQLKWVVDLSEKFLAQTLALPEDSGGTEVYSVSTIVGERFRRDVAIDE